MLVVVAVTVISVW